MKIPAHSFEVCTGKTSQPHGFTRMELLVVIFVVGVVFLLGASAQANFSRQSRAAICLSNLKQLTTGWILYTDDHAGLLPLNNPNLSAGNNWAHGRMDYAGSDSTNVAYLIERQYATLGPYARNAALYRCPSDTSRAVLPRSAGTAPRVRSYAMNNYVGKVPDNNEIDDGYRSYRYMSDIIKPRPENLTVFFDAHPRSISSIAFKIDHFSGFQVIMDYPAYWHNRGGTVSFADGHVVIRQWQDRQTLLPASTLSINFRQSLSNPDVQWISEHSSSPRNN